MRIRPVSLKTKLFIVMFLITGLFAVFSVRILVTSWAEEQYADLNELRSNLAEQLNAAAALQAIERGVGNTIIGSDRTLLETFRSLGIRSDAQVAKAYSYIETFRQRGFFSDDLENAVEIWRQNYDRLKQARSKVGNRDISSQTWLTLANANILSEFDLRNLVYSPRDEKEAILYYDTVLIPNLAILVEFAGRERALIGNALAEGWQISIDVMAQLQRYRSRVEQAVRQVLLLKKLSSTPVELQSAISSFEADFLGDYEKVRQAIYAASTKSRSQLGRTQATLAATRKEILSHISGLSSELSGVASSHFIRDAGPGLIRGDISDVTRVQNLLTGLSATKKEISQLRYLDMTGMERIRINAEDEIHRPVPTKRLQNKSDRYYFTAAKNLREGQVYVSPLDLNVEWGHLEKPLKPMLRFATPIFDEGQPQGVLVLNYSAGRLLKDIPENSFLVAPNGFYLRHPNPNKEWGMMAELERKSENIAQDIPGFSNEILAGGQGVVFDGGVDAYAYLPIQYDSGSPRGYWVLVKTVPAPGYPIDSSAWIERATTAINSALAISAVARNLARDSLDEQKDSARLFSIVALVAVTLVTGTLMIFSVGIVSVGRRIKSISSGLRTLAGGDFSWRIPIRHAPTAQGDEIDGIVSGINEMAIERKRVETELKESVEALRRAQRLEAIGQLTGGIAHDFNNLLGVMIGNAEIIKRKISEDEKLQSNVEAVIKAVERGASLTQRLLAFSRQQTLLPKPTAINDLVVEHWDMLQRILGETIKITMNLKSEVYEVLIDPHQFESALLNLSINARDAMPNGGVLTIETTNATLDAAYAKQHEEVVPGDYTEFTVSDTGFGMTPEVLEKAYEPFFTTKGVGEGSGLGLSMVYGFVKQSNGHITIDSEVGHGTTVKLYLPRSKEAVAHKDATDEAVELALGSERILVVEDDENLRDIPTTLLREQGYEVIDVKEGWEAIKYLQGDQPFDLLFTDVVLPKGKSGLEVAQEAERLQPNIKVIYTSGYAENTIAHQSKLKANAILINKPYGRVELLAKVRETLDSEDS